MTTIVRGLILAITVLAISACASMSLSYQELNLQGHAAYYVGRFDVATELYSQSLESATAAGDKQYAAIAMYGLGRAYGHMCKLKQSEAWLKKSIEERE